jgi:hypothetical protein
LRIHVAFVLVLLASVAVARTLTGTVKNSTTGKPSAGDEVAVFTLDQGMKESGHTTTDPLGHFSFKLDGAVNGSQTPHLVRVIHQGVTYHRVAPPKTTSVAIEVYDVAKKVNGIGVIADIMRIQASRGQIAVTRDFGVRNTSNPPRTQMNDRSLEFYIPEDAHIIENSGTAIPENGAPLQSAPVSEGEKNRYSFIFPLRPGLTHFEVTYLIPYSGRANLDPRSIYPLEHFLVLLPKSMQFKAAAASAGFKVVQSPTVPNATAQVASNTTNGQNLAFNVSGEGMLETSRQPVAQDSGQHQDSSTAGGGPVTQPRNRPGGGLGPPVDAPDPLQKYRWWIFGSSAAVLIIGCVYVARQQSRMRAYSSQCALQDKRHYESAEAGMMEAMRTPAARVTSGLITGIKEELFQIEVERKRGQISQPEFERVKAALGQTLDLALRREAQKVEASDKVATV